MMKLEKTKQQNYDPSKIFIQFQSQTKEIIIN